MWFLNWWPYAISHGLNPFWTSYLWEPLGANLLWTTSIPLPSLLAEPITQLFGVVASYNILILLSPVAAAMCAFLLFRQFAGTVPSVLGSYVFGFSSYEISQMTGHLNLTLVFVVPLLAWVWVKAFKKGHPGWVSVAAAGVMFIALFGISLELFATTIIFGTLAALLAWIVAVGSRSAILRASALVALGLAIACILLTPWIYELLTHIHNIPPGAPIFYSTDVLNWFVPTPITFLGGSAFQTVASHFGGNYSEEGGYIGLPLLAILVIVTVQRWKISSVVRFCSLFTGMTLLASLGPILHVDGITIMTMPWAFVYNLPLIKDALPARFMMYSFLGIGLLLAVWLEHARGSLGMWLLGLAALLALVPNSFGSDPYWLNTVNVPSFFRSGEVQKYFPHNANILVLPYAGFGEGDLYQVASGMYFRMPEGHVGPTPIRFAAIPFINQLSAGPLANAPYQNNELRVFIQATHVMAVVDIGASPAIFEDKQLFRKVVRIGDAEIGYVNAGLLHGVRGGLSAVAEVGIQIEFKDLLQATRQFVRAGNPLTSLYPLGLEQKGFLSPSYGGSSKSTPGWHWTKYGGWVGPWAGGDIGIGIAGSWTEVAPIVNEYGCVGTQLFYPYPKLLAGHISPQETGRLVIVFQPQSIPAGIACGGRG